MIIHVVLSPNQYIFHCTRHMVAEMWVSKLPLCYRVYMTDRILLLNVIHSRRTFWVSHRRRYPGRPSRKWPGALRFRPTCRAHARAQELPAKWISTWRPSLVPYIGIQLSLPLQWLHGFCYQQNCHIYCDKTARMSKEHHKIANIASRVN